MKKSFLIITLLAMAGISFITISEENQSNNEVPFPEGYRNWSHIKTAIIGEKSPAFPSSGGFHHIYANNKALEGYRSGKFPDGSIIVFDVIEAVEKNSDISEGKRRRIDVMIKDSQKYASTDGWGFEEFEGDSKTKRNVLQMSKTKCYDCHSSQKQNDLVFSKYRQ